ncbi:MAG: hypothetical protein AAF621_07675 [Pseudomonadota bacterium]
MNYSSYYSSYHTPFSPYHHNHHHYDPGHYYEAIPKNLPQYHHHHDHYGKYMPNGYDIHNLEQHLDIAQHHSSHKANNITKALFPDFDPHKPVPVNANNIYNSVKNPIYWGWPSKYDGTIFVPEQITFAPTISAGQYKIGLERALLQQKAAQLVAINQGNFPTTPHKKLAVYSGFTPSQHAPVIGTKYDPLTGNQSPPFYVDPYYFGHHHHGHHHGYHHGHHHYGHKHPHYHQPYGIPVHPWQHSFGVPFMPPLVVGEPKPKDPDPVYAVVDGAGIKGDPHFTGADGGQYDVHGISNGIYNILSDKGLQINGQLSGGSLFKAFNKIGVTLDNNQIEVSAGGNVKINGGDIANNGSFLGGTVEKSNNMVTIRSPEYDVIITQQGNYIDIDFASNNVFADNVMPHGLWGVTADSDTSPRNGDRGPSAQGGGAIEDLNGNIIPNGDTEAHKLYLVNDIFDTNFQNFNNFS